MKNSELVQSVYNYFMETMVHVDNAILQTFNYVEQSKEKTEDLAQLLDSVTARFYESIEHVQQLQHRLSTAPMTEEQKLDMYRAVMKDIESL